MASSQSAATAISQRSGDHHFVLLLLLPVVAHALDCSTLRSRIQLFARGSSDFVRRAERRWSWTTAVSSTTWLGAVGPLLLRVRSRSFSSSLAPRGRRGHTHSSQTKICAQRPTIESNTEETGSGRRGGRTRVHSQREGPKASYTRRGRGESSEDLCEREKSQRRAAGPTRAASAAPRSSRVIRKAVDLIAATHIPARPSPPPEDDEDAGLSPLPLLDPAPRRRPPDTRRARRPTYPPSPAQAATETDE